MESEDVDLHVTAQKLERMKRDLKNLLEHERAEAVAEVRRTGEMGDFSENAGYQIAKATLRRINNRIDILTDRIARAVIIEDGPSSVVRIGSMVTVRSDGKTTIFHIVGSQESDPSRGKISHASPIGAALLRAHVGDIVTVKIGEQEKMYEVLKIE